MELKQMFNQAFVATLATAIEAAYPPFGTAAFVASFLTTAGKGANSRRACATSPPPCMIFYPQIIPMRSRFCTRPRCS